MFWQLFTSIYFTFNICTEERSSILSEIDCSIFYFDRSIYIGENRFSRQFIHAIIWLYSRDCQRRISLSWTSHSKFLCGFSRHISLVCFSISEKESSFSQCHGECSRIWSIISTDSRQSTHWNYLWWMQVRRYLTKDCNRSVLSSLEISTPFLNHYLVWFYSMKINSSRILNDNCYSVIPKRNRQFYRQPWIPLWLVLIEH